MHKLQDMGWRIADSHIAYHLDIHSVKINTINTIWLTAQYSFSGDLQMLYIPVYNLVVSQNNLEDKNILQFLHPVGTVRLVHTGSVDKG